MSCMKRGTQVKIAFAAAVIALLIGEVSGGWGFSSFLNKEKQKAEAADSQSNVNMSAPKDKPVQVAENVWHVEINILSQGVVFNGRCVSFKELDRHIGSIAASSKDSSEKVVVTVYCMLDSPHGYLIRVLDICHKYKMGTPYIFTK